jgi:hypothetical protein
MDEVQTKLIGTIVGLLLLGVPALAILWATAFAICKLVYEDFFND